MEAFSNLSAWLDKSSQPFPSPASMKPPTRTYFGKSIAHPVEMVVVGRYAEILPWDFSTLPTSDFDEHALPLFISLEQAAALNLPPVADLSPPAGQGRAFERLAHIVAKLEDAKLGLARREAVWRGQDGWQDRQCAILPLFSADTPVADQIATQMPPGVDLTGVPVVAVPVFKFTPKERVATAHRLPFIP